MYVLLSHKMAFQQFWVPMSVKNEIEIPNKSWTKCWIKKSELQLMFFCSFSFDQKFGNILFDGICIFNLISVAICISPHISGIRHIPLLCEKYTLLLLLQKKCILMLPARLSPLLLTSYSASSLLEDGLVSQSPILLLLTTLLYIP